MAAAIQKLHDDFLSCNICTELYQDPCTLACGHTFCRSCLGTFTKSKPDAIKAKSFLCPNCRQMTKVPNPRRSVDDWVKQIKPSFIIVGLLDSFVSQSESDMVSENFCFSCKQSGEKTPASSHCIDCDVSICARCTKGHKAMPGTSHHVITDVGEDVKVKRKRKVMCKAHNSIIEFCCKYCHKAVCNKCCILDHRKCDNGVTIESMVPEMKSVLTKKKHMMTVEVKRKKSAFTQKEKEIKVITGRRADIQTEMSNVVEKVIRLIKKKHKQLEDELAMLTEKEIGDLKGQMKSEEIDIQMYQQHSEFTDQVLVAESEMDMYDMYRMCQSEEITILSDADPQLKDVSEVNAFTFVSEFDQTDFERNLKLGSIRIIQQRFDLKCKPTLVDTIDIRKKGDKEKPDPCDVVVLDCNNTEVVLITDCNNECVKSFYLKNKRSCCSKLELDGMPWSITRLTNKQVAVSFEGQSILVTVNVTPDLVLLSIISTQKQYKGIYALNESTIVAGCRDPLSLDILDITGQVQRSIGTDEKLMRSPSFLYTTADGNILVSDLFSGSVYCLTLAGEVVFNYHPSGERRLCIPRGITTSSTGHILVADKAKKKVILLTPTGDFVRDLLVPEEDGFKPRGIYLHKDKLYVTIGDGPVRVYRC